MRKVLASFFVLAAVAAACGDAAVEQPGTTGTTAVPATVADSITTAGEAGGPVTFEQAADLVVAGLIGPGTPEMPVIVFGRSEPLQAGDVLTLQRPFPDDDDGVIATIEAETYVFWIDDAAGAYFAHPVRFAFVDPADGTLTALDAEWPAALNGTGLWTADEDYWDPANWVYHSGVAMPEAVGPPRAVPAVYAGGISAAVTAAFQGGGARSEAILIHGWAPGQTHSGEMTVDVMNMDAALSGLGASTEAFSRVDEPANRARLEAAFEEARTTLKAGDTLFVYLTAHGDIARDGTAWADSISEYQLREWLTGFAPCVKIVVQIHSCHSGGFLDSMADVADLTMVSTSEDLPSWGDLDPVAGDGVKADPNPGDEGSENTSGMVEALRAIAADPAQRAAIEERIAESGESFLQAAAALGFSEAMRLDAGALNGWSRPSTQMGSEPATSCEEPLDGYYFCGFKVSVDLRNHGPYVNMWATGQLRFDLTPNHATTMLTVTGPPPFVPVTGTLEPDGTVTATGMGTVAGYHDVGVELLGTLDATGFTGTYEMGTGGELPGQESITYEVTGTRVPDGEDPGGGAEAAETPEAFYERFVTAMHDGDAEWPLSRLHPAVLDVYGEQVCRDFMGLIFEPTLEIEVVEVGAVGPWVFDYEDGATEVPDATSVTVDITAAGVTNRVETHLVEIDGLYHWFTRCATG